MMSVDIDENLREQSKLLLRKLKDRQGKLQNIVQVSNAPITNGLSTSAHAPKVVENKDQSCTNVKEMLDTSLKKTVDKTARNGKEKLQKLTKYSKRDKEQENYTRFNDQENFNESYSQKLLKSKELEMRSASPLSREDNMDWSTADYNGSTVLKKLHNEIDNQVNDVQDTGSTVLKKLRNEIDNQANDVEDESKTFAKRAETPNTVRCRKIIDKNIRVGGTANLNESELLRDCEEFPRLNFSYSNVDDADLQYLQSKFSYDTEPKVIDDEIPVRDTDGQETGMKGYADKLENPGNSRKIAKFIRETGKPKSILLSNSQRQNRVSIQ